MIFKKEKPRFIKSILFSIIILIAFVFSASPTLAQTVFPGASWQEKLTLIEHQTMGLDSTKLDQFATNVGGNGVIVKDGYIVKKWGNEALKGDWASAGKPVLTTLLFFATQEGLVSSVDEPIMNWGWALQDDTANPQNPPIGNDQAIAFRHLANMISGYARPEGPGTNWAYNDYAIALYCATLKNVYMPNTLDAALTQRLTPLQLQDGTIITSRNNCGTSTSPRDFARIGWLWLNRGNWNGQQILPSAYFDNFMKPYVGSLPHTNTSIATNDYLGTGTQGGESYDNRYFGQGIYGFNWWFNGFLAPSHPNYAQYPGNRTWPSAPVDTFQANGHGTQEIMTIIPSLNMVVAARGSWGTFTPGNPNNTGMNLNLKTLADAVIKKPQDGQIMIDPYNPSWLVYNRDNNGDGRLDPYFLAGPGDPEDFLYRGGRNADGTRGGITADQMTLINKLKGTGANSIYMQIIRSHGGDGDATHNPFNNNNPTQGLNTSVLDQWETWFTEMDTNGITIFLFFYDDAINVSQNLAWPLDVNGNLHPTEKSFIEGIVNRFEHHKNLIWIIMEEVEEMGGDYQNHAPKIAETIRLADNYNHIIASHQHSSLVFRFPDDPNIDQFAIQYNPATVNPDILHSGMVTAWNNTAGRYNLNMSEIANGRIGTGATARKNAWGIVMGGAYVMIQGMDIAGSTVSDIQDMGRIVSFFESTDFNTMAPHDELKFGQTQYVLANPGVSYIAYTDNATSDLGILNLPSSKYNLVWLDTVTGNKVTLTNIDASGNTIFSKPLGIGGEVALYVQNTQGGTIPPVSPTPTLIQSPTPTPGGPTPTPVSDLITDISVVTGKVYALNLLKTGEKVYIDRNYTFTTIPSHLIDQVYIRTANDAADQSNTSTTFLTFSVTTDAVVYVGYDVRASQLPTWLSDGTWTNTGLVLGGSDTDFNLFQKNFTDGSQIVLGGNLQSPASGAGSMYTVVVAPQQTSPTPTLKPGDTNNDQQVDTIDINNIITNFNLSTYTQGDFNNSGVVNILDLSILLSNFGL